jgi:Bacterial protein of unknown function (DUF839)
MRISLWAAVTIALLGCRDETTSRADTSSVPTSRPAVGFRTRQPAQARKLKEDAELLPLISTGDLIPGTTLPWSPIPDGLGAYRDGSSLVVYSNHEITATGVTSTNGGPAFTFSRVSRLKLDTASLLISSGDYVEDGTGGYSRFCSSTWADAVEGFPSGYFFAGEEGGATNKGSIVVAYAKAGGKTELPHLGAMSHENTVAVPGFRGKVVAFTTDDSNGQSELYMYVATTEADFIAGSGKLYALKTDAKSSAGKPLHSGNLTPGQAVAAYFVEIPNPAALNVAPSQRYDTLQGKVDALGALPFVRLEDADYDRTSFSSVPKLYFVDTGNDAISGRAAVGADCGGVCDKNGSLYSLTLNQSDPTRGAVLTLIKRSKGVDDAWASPDNIATSASSIMVMEDPATSGWDGRRSPGIWNAKFIGQGKLGPFKEVIEVTQTSLIPQARPGFEARCIDTRGTCWETSGIISTATTLGPGTWLFNVQAHTLPFATQGPSATSYGNEGGQLIYLKLPDS